MNIIKRIDFFENGRIMVYNNVTESSTSYKPDKDKLIRTIEGEDACAAYMWFIEYDELKQNERDLINIFYNDVENRVNAKTHPPDKLLENCYNWCLKVKTLRIKCPRCGGTGNYSYNPRDGVRCWKCNGLKYVLPNLSKKFLKAVATEYDKIRRK